jgi:hypothetical protein
MTSTPIAEVKQLKVEAHQECVDALQEYVDEARAGQIRGIAGIVQRPDGTFTTFRIGRGDAAMLGQLQVLIHDIIRLDMPTKS